jgi:hypothetical protein
MRRIVIMMVALAACGGHTDRGPDVPGPAVARTVTAAGLDSLPRLTLADGRLVCLAVDQAPCPVTNATANWLHDGKFATWEPRRPVELWLPNSPNPELLGTAGNGDSAYDIALSAAATRTGYAVLSLGNQRVLSYDEKGRLLSSMPVPPGDLTRARGYSGDIAFTQLIGGSGKDSAATFEVREIDGLGDTTGIPVLKSNLEWLRIGSGKVTAPLPLFPTLPSYGFAADSDVVWSRGEVLTLERRSVHGVLRWSLTSDVTGPPVTPDEIAKLRAKLPPGDKGREIAFDSSAAHTAKFFPAVSGLLIAPDGRVVVAGSQVPSRDSVDYFTLSKSGQPVGRFTMPKRTRPLLFGGDSLLVQRAGANAQQELRWLVLRKR